MICRFWLFFLSSPLWFQISSQAVAGDNFRYGSIEQVRTKTDARQRFVNLEISRGNATRHHSLSYELIETPKGSTESKVNAVDFHRDVELTEVEVETLFNCLIVAGVFHLPLSAEHRGEGSIWTVFGSLKGRAFELSYRRAPRNGFRKKVDDAVTGIVREFALDQISGPAYATIFRQNGVNRLQPADSRDGTTLPAVTESDGDSVPPRLTTLAHLISHADEFNGKRVSVVGFYRLEFEGCELRTDKNSDCGQNLWCDTISAFASREVILSDDCWARVDGTFLKGPAGHMGLWPGELTRVTRFDVQNQPTVTERDFTPGQAAAQTSN